MGNQSFQITGKGQTNSEAYSDLVEDANIEYGHQEGYSGAINSTYGFTDVTKKYKDSGKKLQQYIDDAITRIDSGSCQCICLEEPKANTNKIKSQVEHIVEAGTKKWLLKYKVSTGWREDRVIGIKDSKGDAVKLAREYTEKHKTGTQIEMVKVLDKGSTVVAKIKYKQSTTEKPGKWIFFGLAKC